MNIGAARELVDAQPFFQVIAVGKPRGRQSINRAELSAGIIAVGTFSESHPVHRLGVH